MSAEIIDQRGHLLQIRNRGELRKIDHDRMIGAAREVIVREGKVGVLTILDGFQGWERHEGWGDVSFMMGDGENIEKMAIVGDEKWRDDALVFTAAGLAVLIPAPGCFCCVPAGHGAALCRQTGFSGILECDRRMNDVSMPERRCEQCRDFCSSACGLS